MEDNFVTTNERYAVTPPAWSPPSSAMPTPPQPTTPEFIYKSARDTEETCIEELIPAQINNGDDQHDGGEGHQPCVDHDVEVKPVENPEARPVRQRKPNMRTKRRRTPRRAK